MTSSAAGKARRRRTSPIRACSTRSMRSRVTSEVVGWADGHHVLMVDESTPTVVIAENGGTRSTGPPYSYACSYRTRKSENDVIPTQKTERAAGLRPDDGLHAALPVAAGAHSLGRTGAANHDDGLGAVRRHGHAAADPGFLSLERGGFAGRGDGERRFRLPRGLGPGALYVSGQEADRCDRRSAVCPAHGRVGNRAQRALRPRRLDRPPASPAAWRFPTRIGAW